MTKTRLQLILYNPALVYALFSHYLNYVIRSSFFL